MVRLNDLPGMTIAVVWDVKPQTKQTNNDEHSCQLLYFHLTFSENVCHDTRGRLLKVQYSLFIAHLVISYNMDLDKHNNVLAPQYFYDGIGQRMTIKSFLFFMEF